MYINVSKYFLIRGRFSVRYETQGYKRLTVDLLSSSHGCSQLADGSDFYPIA